MGSACTVPSCCKSPAEVEENIVTSTSNYTMPEPRNATTSPHQCEPTISGEESKEGSPQNRWFRRLFCRIKKGWFGSKVLPESERNVHASLCSMITAVTCTDSDDAKSVRKTSVAACPCCGEYFEVPQLVEHVPRCKEVSRLKAEELWLKDGSPSSSVIGVADCMEDPSVCDRELCPTCLEEFSVLELLNHAEKCREEELRTCADVEYSLEDARLTIEDDWNVRSLASSTKTREGSADREAEDSNGLISPPYSYYDCEEQCLYCLKMFAVSVLVEHACNCASRHEVRYFYENIPWKVEAEMSTGIGRTNTWAEILVITLINSVQ